MPKAPHGCPCALKVLGMTSRCAGRYWSKFPSLNGYDRYGKQKTRDQHVDCEGSNVSSPRLRFVTMFSWGPRFRSVSRRCVASSRLWINSAVPKGRPVCGVLGDWTKSNPTINGADRQIIEYFSSVPARFMKAGGYLLKPRWGSGHPCRSRIGSPSCGPPSRYAISNSSVRIVSSG
jgi:hypothetical protein